MARIGVTLSIGSVGPSNIPTAAFSNAYVVGQTPWGQRNLVTL